MVFGLSQELFQLLCHFCLTFKNVKHDLQNHNIFIIFSRSLFYRNATQQFYLFTTMHFFWFVSKKSGKKFPFFPLPGFRCVWDARDFCTVPQIWLTVGRLAQTQKLADQMGKRSWIVERKRKKETERQRETIHCIWMCLCVFVRERHTGKEEGELSA